MKRERDRQRFFIIIFPVKVKEKRNLVSSLEIDLGASTNLSLRMKERGWVILALGLKAPLLVKAVWPRSCLGRQVQSVA